MSSVLQYDILKYYHLQSSLTPKVTFMKDFTHTLLYLIHISQFCFVRLGENILQGMPNIWVQIR